MSRVAVVTGGASGIGLAVSQHLAQRAHRVAVLDLDGDAAQRAADSLRAARCAGAGGDGRRGGPGHGRRRARPRPPRARAGRDHGHERGHRRVRRLRRDQPRRRGVRRSRSTSPARSTACKRRSPTWSTPRWGRIVTIASSAGQIGSPRQAHYAASKGGVIALTKTLAREFGAHGITANTIPPFLVDTPMSRAAAGGGRHPEPRD